VAPRATRSYSLDVVDLDARGFIHWHVTGIPARTRSLTASSRVGHQGKNDFGRIGYGGPCPPRGSQPHRYRFTLEALGPRGRVLSVARLTGRYNR
jgi:phosphatidylethanolamine-binding protein (PEBP) family uncharacterized protein